MDNPINEKRDDLESMASTKFVEDSPYSGAVYVTESVFLFSQSFWQNH